MFSSPARVNFLLRPDLGNPVAHHLPAFIQGARQIGI
jgi:hypothetical protein